MNKFEVQKYFEKKKELYNNILLFLENYDSTSCSFDDLYNILQKQNFGNQEELVQFLRLLANISENHHRELNFMTKIEQILFNMKETIKKTLTNYQIIEIFMNNKLILLFLIQNNIIKIDEQVINSFTFQIDTNGTRYSHFFLPEIKKFLKSNESQINESDLSEPDSDILFNYEQKRQIGENDSYICSLIRNDSIAEFVSYVNRGNISLISKINPSIYETNSFLLNNHPNLIEYSTFYGSIQIFKYLHFNNVELDPKLWIYAIHSKNSELIHILEEFHVQPEDKSYAECYLESIKCHHNDIAFYIKDNYLNIEKSQLEEFNDLVVEYSFKYCNYLFLPNNFNRASIFYYLCKNCYDSFIKMIVENTETKLKNRMIQRYFELISITFFIFNFILKSIFFY